MVRWETIDKVTLFPVATKQRSKLLSLVGEQRTHCSPRVANLIGRISCEIQTGHSCGLATAIATAIMT